LKNFEVVQGIRVKLKDDHAISWMYEDCDNVVFVYRGIESTDLDKMPHIVAKTVMAAISDAGLGLAKITLVVLQDGRE
jgi:hypothetical protein